MTAPTPLERLEQALAELGALTPDGIADLMRAKGIKAKPTASCSCAVAVYLESLGIGEPSIGPDQVPGGRWYVHSYQLNKNALLPEPVAEFARRFDAGVYLDLVGVPA